MPHQVNLSQYLKGKKLAALSLGIFGLGIFGVSQLQGYSAAQAQIPHEKNLAFEDLHHQENGWKVLNDPRIKMLIRSTMGYKDEEFWNCTQLVSPPQVIDHKMLVSANVRGLAPDMQSLFCLDLSTHKCWIGYLNDKQYHFYGADNLQTLPIQIQQYLKTLNDPSVSLRFEKPDWKEPARKAKSAKAQLKFSTIAGTYQRINGNRFDNATIVIKFPNHAHDKVHFLIEAQSGGNTGEAEGDVAIEKNCATYKTDMDELHFQFNKNKEIVVSGDDSGLCGMGVTLLGTYKKVAE